MRRSAVEVREPQNSYSPPLACLVVVIAIIGHGMDNGSPLKPYNPLQSLLILEMFFFAGFLCYAQIKNLIIA